ncbi:MAG: hypothetical protein AB1778_01210 [Candidatus Bipolaricaulota bacterium]
MLTRGAAREARLWYWNRLFHGVAVDELDLTPALLCADPQDASEARAFALLRACAALFASSRTAVCCALRISILYWFSNVGRRRGAAREPLRPKRSAFHLGEAVGTGLTWDEAVALMGHQPIDFSAYLKLLELLEAEVARQWTEHFPQPSVRNGFLGDGGSEGRHVSPL